MAMRIGVRPQFVRAIRPQNSKTATAHEPPIKSIYVGKLASHRNWQKILIGRANEESTCHGCLDCQKSYPKSRCKSTKFQHIQSFAGVDTIHFQCDLDLSAD
jgi:hypothetical protein